MLSDILHLDILKTVVFGCTLKYWLTIYTDTATLGLILATLRHNRRTYHIKRQKGKNGRTESWVYSGVE